MGEIITCKSPFPGGITNYKTTKQPWPGCHMGAVQVSLDHSWAHVLLNDLEKTVRTYLGWVEHVSTCPGLPIFLHGVEIEGVGTEDKRIWFCFWFYDFDPVDALQDFVNLLSQQPAIISSPETSPVLYKRKIRGQK